MRQRRIETILARHQLITVLALIVLVVLAWAWLVTGAAMEAHPAQEHGAHHDASPMTTMGPSPTSVTAQLAITFAMWWVMMIAMMLPSAASMILLYGRASARLPGGTRAATASFTGAYLVVWGLFAGAATLLQLALERFGLVTPALNSASPWLTSALLFLTGLYQLSPAKHACLYQCRNPAQFISRHFRRGAHGAARMGAIHGAYCVGCCWGLMALLFIGGVMNLAWIALLTVLVAAEKLLGAGRQLSQAAGAILILSALTVAVMGAG